MDLTQLANLGEFIGGVAVLVTLVYLAVQVRQGNELERRGTHRAWVSDMNQILFEPMRDPHYMALVQKAARDFDALDRTEQGSVNGLWSPLMMLCEEMHLLQEQGAVSSRMTEVLDTFATSFLQLPGAAMWWSRLGPTLFSRSFYEHQQKRIASPDRPPPLDQLLPWYISDEAEQNEGPAS